MRLTLFDLDNTLLSGDSDYAWGQFAVRNGLVDADAYASKNAAFYAEYQNGCLDQRAYLEFCLEPLSRRTMAELDGWHRRFMADVVEPMMSPAGKALVRERLDAGDLCAIITSTNSFVTAPIARAYGIAHLIASEADVADGRYTGRVNGIPAFREGKVERLRQWLDARGQRIGEFSETWFFSDSINDLPLLDAVTHPVAVDPDRTLMAIARERGWPVMSLREQG